MLLLLLFGFVVCLFVQLNANTLWRTFCGMQIKWRIMSSTALQEKQQFVAVVVAVAAGVHYVFIWPAWLPPWECECFFLFNWSYILEQQLAQCGLILAMTSQSWLAVTIISTLVTLSLRGIAEGMTIETAVVYILTLIGVCPRRDKHSYISYIVYKGSSTHLRVAGALAPRSAWFVLLTLLRAESYVDHQKHNRKNLRSNWTLSGAWHKRAKEGVEQWAIS